MALEEEVGRRLTLDEVIGRRWRRSVPRSRRSSGGCSSTSGCAPGFHELVDAHDPLIVSAGFHELIEPILAREGVSARLVANHVDAGSRRAGGRRFPRRPALRGLRRAVQALAPPTASRASPTPATACPTGASSLAAERRFARDGLARLARRARRRLRAVRRPARRARGAERRVIAGGTSRFPQTPSTGPLRGQAATPPAVRSSRRRAAAGGRRRSATSARGRRRAPGAPRSPSRRSRRSAARPSSAPAASTRRRRSRRSRRSRGRPGRGSRAPSASCIAPIAIRSLEQITAVGRSPFADSTIARSARRPPSTVKRSWATSGPSGRCRRQRRASSRPRAFSRVASANASPATKPILR